MIVFDNSVFDNTEFVGIVSINKTAKTVNSTNVTVLVN